MLPFLLLKSKYQAKYTQSKIHEYYHTEEIKWIACKNEWKGLKSIGMEEKTIIKEGEKKKEILYKQFERRYRFVFKGGERSLERRKYALVSRCNIYSETYTKPT